MRSWIRRHPLFGLFTAAILGLTAFLIVDSGCLSREIPNQTRGSEFLPQDAPYAGYTPVMTQQLLTWFGTLGSFNNRAFSEGAGPSIIQNVTHVPALETSMDPLFPTGAETSIYLCSAEVSYALLPDPSRPVGELGFVYVGKLRIAATPVVTAELLINHLEPGLSWHQEGDRRVATRNGTPVLWLWINSGWLVIGDSAKAVDDALHRVKFKEPSLATNPDFVATCASQNTLFGMLSYTNLRSANAFLLSTGKPNNIAFAEGLERHLPAVSGASWGWSPHSKTSFDQDVYFYPVDAPGMDWLRQRYSKIDLKTAALTNEQTAYYAPFSVPLAALEQGDFTEMPLLAGPARDWLKIFGQSSTTSVFTGEGAYLIDIPPTGPAMQAIAFALKDPAALRQALLHLGSDRSSPPQEIRRGENLVEISGTDWTVQLQVRDDFLIVTIDPAAQQHFATKLPGPTILERPALSHFVSSAQASTGTLVGGIVYDSQKIFFHWQDQALPHWQDFAPLLNSIHIELKEKPAPLQPDQVFTGGACFVFLKDRGVEVRHELDQSHPPYVVPISTTSIATNFFYGKAHQARYDWFFQHTAPPDSSLSFLVKNFLRSEDVFMPGFTRAPGVMIYDPLLAFTFNAMNPPLPLSGPPESSPNPVANPEKNSGP